MPIECTDRDALYALDGVLYNESDLKIEEHHIDTHGFTELNFNACGMLAKRHCPRIKGVQNQRIYRIDKNKDYGCLSALVSRHNRTINPSVISEQRDRMAQFYAGHATASLTLKRFWKK